jgi:hypothetical protein
MNKEELLYNHIVKHSIGNDPNNIVECIDKFCWHEDEINWMMNIGDVKGCN